MFTEANAVKQGAAQAGGSGQVLALAAKLEPDEKQQRAFRVG